MNKAMRIGEVTFDYGRAQGRPRIRVEVQWRPKNHFFGCDGMLQGQLGGVQIKTRSNRASVERIAKNRETAVCGVDANLVRAAGEGLGFKDRVGADVRRPTYLFGSYEI